MKKIILEYIKAHPTTTFANLMNDIPGFTGEFGMAEASFPNVILWPSVSQEGITALSELMAEGEITMETASQLSYAIDGQIPTMEVAKGFKAYKSPRWLPVCFSQKSKSQIWKSGKKSKK